jgi:hypothetical protein
LVVHNSKEFVGYGMDLEFLLVELEMNVTAFRGIISDEKGFQIVILINFYKLYSPLFYILQLSVGYLTFGSDLSQFVFILDTLEDG